MSVDYPDELLEAIIAPELSHLDLNTRNMDPVFSGISSVFSEVHCLCLRSSTMDSVVTVCQVFPNIRHLEVGDFASAFFHGLQERTDLWSNLERVTFRSLHASVLEGTVTELQTWLQQRKPTAKPLHLQFTCIKRRSYWETTGDILSMLYNSLHEDCTFEVDQFPLMERTRKGFFDSHTSNGAQIHSWQILRTSLMLFPQPLRCRICQVIRLALTTCPRRRTFFGRNQRMMFRMSWKTESDQ
ncbi:hypothetical protein EDC04DRAFT_1563983 [Pisolithus marmoratus]|nr:hypothetical protein EDC04DRAFT_1563983 [Pisolithus marmoratus]